MKTSIAIFCSQGLGDALLQMIIANNLAVNNYDVTFYSDFAYQLKDYVDNYQIKPSPLHTDVVNESDKYHVSLYDFEAPYIKRMNEEARDWLKHNAIAYRMISGKFDHMGVKVDAIKARLPEPLKANAVDLIRFNNPIREFSISPRRKPMSDQICGYLERIIGLENVSNSNGFTIPFSDRQNTKVLIHPTSSNIKKNWMPDQYLDLAKKLKNIGFQPVFTVSPSELNVWHNILKDEFDAPQFDNIASLAHFYKDAAWFIGNDSGNAHLASCLGVPTYQIFRGWRSYPSWRAGWSNGRIIKAKFPYFLSKNNWQKGLNVERVFKGFCEWISFDKSL